MWLLKSFPWLLTDTFVSALVVAWAALVPLAVVCLHCLPVGRLVGDPERITQSNRTLWPSTGRNRKSAPQKMSRQAAATCGACICRRSEGPSRAPLWRGRKDASRTPSLRWWSWKAEQHAYFKLFTVRRNRQLSSCIWNQIVSRLINH